ncbi:MAG: hypothetical protein ACOC55_03400 [Candidatus Natronoplasma sp.]
MYEAEADADTSQHRVDGIPVDLYIEILFNEHIYQHDGEKSSRPYVKAMLSIL